MLSSFDKLQSLITLSSKLFTYSTFIPIQTGLAHLLSAHLRISLLCCISHSTMKRLTHPPFVGWVYTLLSTINAAPNPHILHIYSPPFSGVSLHPSAISTLTPSSQHPFSICASFAVRFQMQKAITGPITVFKFTYYLLPSFFFDWSSSSHQLWKGEVPSSI